jgi:hypothetical protein
MCLNFIPFTRVRIVAKSANLTSPYPSAISVPLALDRFLRNLILETSQHVSKYSKFGYNRTEISGILHECLNRSYCCRRHKYAPLEHFSATVSITTILLTVTFKWTIHRKSIVEFTLQQWLREDATTLSYTYTACLL